MQRNTILKRLITIFFFFLMVTELPVGALTLHELVEIENNHSGNLVTESLEENTEYVLSQISYLHYTGNQTNFSSGSTSIIPHPFITHQSPPPDGQR